jgi:hypothetical protein
MNGECQREFDFALVLTGVNELSDEILNALFEAGCDDATVSLQYGQLYLEFTRESSSIPEAILSAIQDVRKAKIGADVLRIDQCDLVTPAEIARRMKRSRQLVHQYMAGIRGPGGFPPPECYLSESKPLWSWCPVSFWLHENDLIHPESYEEAEVISTINMTLQRSQQFKRNPDLVRLIEASVDRKEPVTVEY